MIKTYTKQEVLNICSEVQNDWFEGTNTFELKTIPKELLYNKICCDNITENLVSYEWWNNHSDNYDGYHTDNIDQMINYLENGGQFDPLIVNKDYGLYDGQHRLTAYSMVDNVKEIEIFVEL